MLVFLDTYQNIHVIGKFLLDSNEYLSFAVMDNEKNVQSSSYNYFVNKNIIQYTLQLERL